MLSQPADSTAHENGHSRRQATHDLSNCLADLPSFGAISDLKILKNPPKESPRKNPEIHDPRRQFVMLYCITALLLFRLCGGISSEQSATSSASKSPAAGTPNEIDRVNEGKYAVWLKTYKAPRSSHQEYCTDILNGRLQSEGQFQQDLFLFFNIFKYWPMQGLKGFYVDSGANDAVSISNSYFFDVCLGWDGLCVEVR